MPANGTKTAQPKATDSRPTAKQAGRGTDVRENLTKVRVDAVARVRQTTERAVDVPVGVALIAADRVNELVEPWTSTTTRERELQSFRQRVERELNKFERRGGTARRKATRRVRTTRGRVERELRQRRRSVEAAVKENRTKAQDGLRRAQTVVQERVTALV